jgi:hypothetical protein
MSHWRACKAAAPLLLPLLLLTACQNLNLAQEEPAKMQGTPSAECLTQLTTFANDATGRSVTLTEQVFSRSDRMLLDKLMIRGRDGQLIDGRSSERPASFRLLSKAGSCIVTHENSRAKRTTLPACNCQPYQ